MKTRVGSLFNRPLVMGDPNLVRPPEILVETDLDNKIVALKERKKNELSDIVNASDSKIPSTEDYFTCPELEILVDKYLKKGLVQVTDFSQLDDPNFGIIDEDLFIEVITELKPYCVIEQDITPIKNPEKILSLQASNLYYLMMNNRYRYINRTDFYEEANLTIQYVFQKDIFPINTIPKAYMTMLLVHKSLKSGRCIGVGCINLMVNEL